VPTYQLLRAAHPIAESDLQQALDVLSNAELLYVRGIAPDATYQFKHALIRDAAYEALLKSRRRQLHLAVARTIAEEFPSLVETRPEVLARHWTEAGEIASAIAAWRTAGDHAVKRLAYREAEQHFRTALEHLPAAPELAERDALELNLQLALGGVLLLTRGNASPEMERAYIRARQLSEHLGAASQFPALFGLRSIYLVRGEIARAHELGEQLLSQAQRENDAGHLLEAHLAQGNTFSLRGHLAASKTHFEDTLRLYDREEHRSHASIYGFDPAVFSLCRLTWIELFMGYPDRALRKMRELNLLAREVAHPATSTLALMHSSDLHRWCGDIDAARESAEAAVTMGDSHGLRALVAQAHQYAGLALVYEGQPAEGIRRILQGVSALRATGALLFLPWIRDVWRKRICWRGFQRRALLVLRKPSK